MAAWRNASKGPLWPVVRAHAAGYPQLRLRSRPLPRLWVSLL